MGVALFIGLDVAVTLGVATKAFGAVQRNIEHIRVRRPDWSPTRIGDPRRPGETRPGPRPEFPSRRAPAP